MPYREYLIRFQNERVPKFFQQLMMLRSMYVAHIQISHTTVMFSKYILYLSHIPRIVLQSKGFIIYEGGIKNMTL